MIHFYPNVFNENRWNWFSWCAISFHYSKIVINVRQSIKPACPDRYWKSKAHIYLHKGHLVIWRKVQVDFYWLLREIWGKGRTYFFVFEFKVIFLNANDTLELVSLIFLKILYAPKFLAILLVILQNVGKIGRLLGGPKIHEHKLGKRELQRGIVVISLTK